MTPLVFLAAPGDLDQAASGGLILLTGPEAHHALRVQRVKPGELIDLVDGAGLRVRGLVAPAPGGDAGPALAVRVEKVIREENEASGIVLIQALAKGGRDEMAVEAATGLGVERIVPWAAERSVARWREAKAERGRARWQAIARAETKVARRSWVPAVDPLVGTGELAALVGAAVRDGARVFVLHEDAELALVAALAGGAGGAIWLVVGPEGGIAPGELASLAAQGAVPVVLGRAVLRSSAAGPAALAALAAVRALEA